MTSSETLAFVSLRARGNASHDKEANGQQAARRVGNIRVLGRVTTRREDMERLTFGEMMQLDTGGLSGAPVWETVLPNFAVAGIGGEVG